ncbi:AAA family ATPase [Bacillus sp. FJAT-49732]|uniref:AAA family ATPase n=1 Tax=Lederbergia citrisecunda TaxID=2833583 RepID=A0A942TPF8_9BACI|nr:AAA family ATPase [Lederbergia citrisecunda]MBS4201310.1 AAA family ATPase [Lederbergia citrisecunda]
MYQRLNNFTLRFAEKIGVIYTLSQNAPNHIMKVDEEGLYVETQDSRNKFANGEKGSSYSIVKREWVLGSLDKLVENKVCESHDLHEYGMRHSFLIAFLAALPFVEIDRSLSSPAVRLKKYTTADLDPVNFTSLSSNSADKKLESPFIKLIYDMLKYIDDETEKEKRETLLEVIFLTTVSSTSGTVITESVANRRLSDALKWLQNSKLVDQDINVIVSPERGKSPSSFWWVNQGQSAKAETAGGFLWAPKRAKNGAALAHHTDLVKAKSGDVVFAYSNSAIRYICIVEEEVQSASKPSSLATGQWEEDGNLLKVGYFPLETPIQRNDIPEPWRLQEEGPFDRNGNVKQGYFFQTSNDFALKVLEKFSEMLPGELLGVLPTASESRGEETNLMTFDSDSNLISHIYSYITNKGFYFTKESITNFYLCLKTKPFIILSGISGTGKTKIVQLFAESIGATEDNGQFKLIPVRPDWSDGSDLIGYEDIKGDFKPGPFTKVLVEANLPENQNKPYFILLDEMNLARVEYYFSDLLSVMESREKINDQYISSPVIDREEVGKLMLRNNVYIIGTVNMDETTYPFSPKVLDRANTIEYNEVQLENFSIYENILEVTSVTIANEQLAGKFITLKDAFSEHEQLIREITDWLVRLNQILEKIKLHFGYRVRDEVCFYMIYNEQGQLIPREQAFDLQLHQKILPRISGNDYQTQAILKELFSFCTNHMWDENLAYSLLNESRFPKSAEKIEDMIMKIEKDGFTSFWG